MYLKNGDRVKLTVDLTSYLPGLISGSIGIVCEATSMWRNMGAVGVSFDKIGQLDVFPKSLQLIE